MIPFEQYICQSSLLEAKQNYIFGGTDNRAPEITKTFEELEVGDYMLYFNSRSLKTPIRIRIDEIKVLSNRVECKCEFGQDYYAAFTIYATDSQYYESREYPGYYFNAYGTDEKLFIEKLKEKHDLYFYVSDIEDRVVEAKQNYIFGGTDNRNTDICEKTFAELEKGDKFYWFYIHYDDDDKWGASCLEFISVRKRNSYIELVHEEGAVTLRDISVLNDSLYIFGVGTMNMFIASTDYAMFVEAVAKETGKYLTETDITVGKIDRHK